MKPYKIIYEPKNRAGEYGELAANLFRGCGHGCEYCYAPNVLRMNKETFFYDVHPRKNIIENLQKDIIKMKDNDDKREVFLCFTCDPYQPVGVENRTIITDAILMFLKNNIPIRILTKSTLAKNDFDLMASKKSFVNFGMTLVFADDDKCRRYEPHASLTSERIKTLIEAKHIWNLNTWVSLEPTWSKEDVFELIDRTCDAVDIYKIGKLNYHPHAKEVDWKSFAVDVSEYCNDIGINYVLKDDLKNYL